MGRYLMFFSYIGTRYNGLQIQNVKGLNSPKTKTVQGVIKNLLSSINPYHEIKLSTSSRTDAGVHALCNAMHFDFYHKHHPEKSWDPTFITARLNGMLYRAKEDIRILKILRVNDDFNSRYAATGRSYVFRLVFSKNCELRDLIPIPAQEQHTTLCVRHAPDMNLFIKSAEALSGTHDFTAFTTENFLKRNPQKSPVKTLVVGIKRSQPRNESSLQVFADMNYWDVHIHGSSFLYHQVRIIMGAMLNVARGMLSLEDLQRLLDKPSHKYSINQSLLAAVPPSGLFLSRVHYKDEDLVYTPCEDVPLSEEDRVTSLDSSERRLENHIDSIIQQNTKS